MIYNTLDSEQSVTRIISIRAVLQIFAIFSMLYLVI